MWVCVLSLEYTRGTARLDQHININLLLEFPPWEGNLEVLDQSQGPSPVRILPVVMIELHVLIQSMSFHQDLDNSSLRFLRVPDFISSLRTQMPRGGVVCRGIRRTFTSAPWVRSTDRGNVSAAIAATAAALYEQMELVPGFAFASTSLKL